MLHRNSEFFIKEDLINGEAESVVYWAILHPLEPFTTLFIMHNLILRDMLWKELDGDT